MCSCDQSLVTLAILWEKFSQIHFYKDLTRKTAFFKGWFWFKFNNLGLALGTNFKFYTSVAKGLKLMVRKFLGLIPTFVEVNSTTILNRVKVSPKWLFFRLWNSWKKTNKCTMEVKRLRLLALEIFKAFNENSPTFIKDYFEKNENSVSKKYDLKISIRNSVTFGDKSWRS